VVWKTGGGIPYKTLCRILIGRMHIFCTSEEALERLVSSVMHCCSLDLYRDSCKINLQNPLLAGRYGSYLDF
jgi:hypothetical protein